MKQFNKGKGTSQGNTNTWQGKNSQGKSSQGKSPQGKTSQIKIVQGKPVKGKPAQGKTLTDWDSYITKEAGIGKASSGKNNGKSNLKTTKSKSVGTKKLFNGTKGTSKVVAVKKPVTMHMFYMTTEELTCKQIVAPVVEEKGMEIQIWPELGISSIEFGETSSIDFNECEIESFDSDSDIEFLKEHGIKSIYEVTMDEADKAKAAGWFLSMIQTNGGFFCTDSDDFAPIYNTEELERWK